MTGTSHTRPFAAIWKGAYARFSQYLAEKTTDIDHHNVIADLAMRTELDEVVCRVLSCGLTGDLQFYS